MKKIKDNWKKIVGIACCAFVLTGIFYGVNGGISAKAATVGQQLTAPESGWKRFDDNDSKIVYTGDWVTENYSLNYNSTLHYNITTTDKNIQFKFNGTKLRVIGALYTSYGSNLKITIDGVTESFNEYSTMANQFERLVYEKTNLSQGTHNVIINNNGQGITFDAIDIDETGSLVDPSAIPVTGIKLDKTSLDMHPGESIPITAIVTPDNATNKAVDWSSTDDSIAKYQDGNIVAGNEGSAVITVKTQDGNYTATCTVNVKKADSGNGLLTVTMTDGQQRTYDLSMTQVNDFIKWYNGRANGSGDFTYSFNKAPSSGAYSKRTEYLIYDKISNYDVDEYKAN
jgi:Bacterial surface proteins containing Ig-like domains